MLRLLPNLLLLLALLAAACSPDEPEPAPPSTLEGTWSLNATETTELASDGSVQSQTGPVPNSRPTTCVFTNNSLEIRAIATWVYSYTRAGNTLTLTPAPTATFTVPFNQDITTLATTKLDLLDKRGSASTVGGTTLTTFHLVR